MAAAEAAAVEVDVEALDMKIVHTVLVMGYIELLLFVLYLSEAVK